MTRRGIALCCLSVAAGCTGDHALLTTGGPDSGAPDSGPGIVDSGVDSGVPDSGMIDSGIPDAGKAPICWQNCYGPPVVVMGNDVITWTLGTADFNNDGFDDLIQAGEARTSMDAVTLFYGTADGGLVLGPTFTETGLTSAITADLNGDGWMDFIATDGNRIDIELNQTDGGFASTIVAKPLATNCQGWPLVINEVRAADFDGDGRLDLAVCSSGGMFIYFANGEAPSYGAPIQITPQGPCDAGVGDTEWSGEYCFNLAVGDLNGDGKPDIVSFETVSADINPNLYLRLSTPDAGFSLTKLYSSCGSPVLADLNGDGLLDMACSDGAGLEVQFNQGGGTLGPPIIVETYPPVPPALPWGGSALAAVTDLNGDGRPDVVGAGSATNCGGPADGGASYFLNAGGGPFDMGQPLSTRGASVNGITPVRLAGSALPSLAVGDLCDSNILIFSPVDAGR